MPTIRTLFATRIYEASLAGEANFAAFNAELAGACAMLAAEDAAGRTWCKANLYGGYTSYASLDDLPTRASVFAELKRRLDRHAAAFAKALAFDLGPRGRLALDSLWVSVLKPGAAHSGHIHPHAVLSGAVYVTTPPGASGLRLEDPRLPQMMAAPPKRADAADEARAFVTLTPAPGAVFMWESWLRHEVLANRARTPRVSVSFNYAWRGTRRP
ncbi:MAG: TIGR02466 family protein [Caulobacteraceae bacterium]